AEYTGDQDFNRPPQACAEEPSEQDHNKGEDEHILDTDLAQPFGGQLHHKSTNYWADECTHTSDECRDDDDASDENNTEFWAGQLNEVNIKSTGDPCDRAGEDHGDDLPA